MDHNKLSLPSEGNALKGRSEAMPIVNQHFVHQRPIKQPFNVEVELIQFGLGCFWGAERKFWQLDGVYSTAVGYAGGLTKNPNYEEVCSGLTGHNEVVLVAYQSHLISFDALLKVFFESHNPTQGMRQGNDIGTQYRSGIYCYTPQQKQQAEQAQRVYQTVLHDAGYTDISTEILDAETFYYAETYHQQYLAKNPNGYCGLGGTGLECVI